MNRALTFELWESFRIGFRLPINISATDGELDDVESVDWRELDWQIIGDDGESIVWLKLIHPFNEKISSGIIVDIQLIKYGDYDGDDNLNQIHISMAEVLKGKGLGPKIYRSLIEWTGHLYSGRKRRHNPVINRIWKDLKSDSSIICGSNELGDICISRDNVDIDKIVYDGNFNIIKHERKD